MSEQVYCVKVFGQFTDWDLVTPGGHTGRFAAGIERIETGSVTMFFMSERDAVAVCDMLNGLPPRPAAPTPAEVIGRGVLAIIEAAKAKP